MGRRAVVCLALVLALALAGDPALGDTPEIRHVASKSAKAEAKAYARRMVANRWPKAKARQWRCLRDLWQRESGWDYRARNPRSGAGGIPQALPPSKMGRNWEVDWKVQVRWGVRYVKGRYGSPCKAWGHFQRRGWY